MAKSRQLVNARGNPIPPLRLALLLTLLLGCFSFIPWVRANPRLAASFWAAAAALLWGAAHLCAMSYSESLRRAGFTGEVRELGEQLFDAMLTHRSGVTFTVDPRSVHPRRARICMAAGGPVKYDGFTMGMRGGRSPGDRAPDSGRPRRGPRWGHRGYHGLIARECTPQGTPLTSAEIVVLRDVQQKVAGWMGLTRNGERQVCVLNPCPLVCFLG